ncbi:hypothetical protein QJS04_geneDACA011907 [Acorus gramineus]|uniref:30S ribosomal protein 3, chloroplastic n=1 Tax=Acorus gramineus TaxID=55184 RepID=A0AAV9AI49_ACOGR|nr:hypothetical protein QJS04_geneDACA011907 [Acorus gramineus]
MMPLSMAMPSTNVAPFGLPYKGDPSHSLPFSLHFKPSLSNSLKFSSKSLRPRRERLLLTHASAGAVEAAAAAEGPASSEEPPSEQKEKLGVVVTALEKPRLVLKFIWMEKNIGLALDQVIPGHGPIPLSPYYFWPRKDAWEELKSKLESKPWISQKRMIILLNQATDIINLWQQSGGNL